MNIDETKDVNNSEETEIEASIENIACMLSNLLPNEWCEYSYLNNKSNIAFVNKINATDIMFDVIKNINYIDEMMINKIENIISEFVNHYINSGGGLIFQKGDFDIVLTMVSGVLSLDKSNISMLNRNDNIIKAKKYVNRELMLSDEINDYFSSISNKFKSSHYLIDYYVNFYHEHDKDQGD